MPHRERPFPDDHPYNVLVTAFGPYHMPGPNPSWLAVKPMEGLHIVDGVRHPVRIQTLQIPVSYATVLDIIPPLHAVPPVVAEGVELIPPLEGYDLFLHVGAMGRGPLRIEMVGHRRGYNIKDYAGNLAPKIEDRKDTAHIEEVQEPVVHIIPSSQFGQQQRADARRDEADDDILVLNSEGKGLLQPAGPSVVQIIQPKSQENGDDGVLDLGGASKQKEVVHPPVRGYNRTWENFNLENDYHTGLPVKRMIQTIKQSGFDQIYLSMDAGHYLGDFIYYTSLVEVAHKLTLRPNKYEKRRYPHVLCVHCPPVGEPLLTEDVTHALKMIVACITREFQSMDDQAAADQAAK
ncbi:peptidase C15, pyroglutamyl peptidase I-like protein [Fistulina hepatica ATCC 64428]|uniref:Peptidase C15, pyroglutamyl peptidase I-like protein n=1 Tax=Fistulina hepatica ATCC 64428 TaxID=1128425 RepID=A0A0D7A1X6_9AGAR|nr:peptidase C15, pyroglutamyl peptidase I-like protein [Fistulina hepatica ATCC 64428]